MAILVMDVIFRLNQQISDQFYYFFHYLESIPLYVQGITNCISFFGVQQTIFSNVKLLPNMKSDNKYLFH